eukprot:TRINITY_DN10388_c0_g2_i1.p1 TRINITY_DN10388_c0_g2~~TRINITY_DN10388_c0_g2_i1.p1  ORF type:complete len:912 (-),score=201.02 TRINITY_DN10388_c0_g2_i1:139-2874(-)
MMADPSKSVSKWLEQRTLPQLHFRKMQTQMNMNFSLPQLGRCTPAQRVTTPLSGCNMITGSHCCSSPPNLPDFRTLCGPTAATLSCREKLTAFWCQASCLPDALICQSQLQAIINECQSCPNVFSPDSMGKVLLPAASGIADYLEAVHHPNATMTTPPSNSSNLTNCNVDGMPMGASSIRIQQFTVTGNTRGRGSRGNPIVINSVSDGFRLQWRVRSDSPPTMTTMSYQRVGFVGAIFSGSDQPSGTWTLVTGDDNDDANDESGEGNNQYELTAVWLVDPNILRNGQYRFSTTVSNSAGSDTETDTVYLEVAGGDRTLTACPGGGAGSSQEGEIDPSTGLLQCSCDAACSFRALVGAIQALLRLVMTAAYLLFQAGTFEVSDRFELSGSARTMDFQGGARFRLSRGATFVADRDFEFTGDADSEIEFAFGSIITIQRRLAFRIRLVLWTAVTLATGSTMALNSFASFGNASASVETVAGSTIEIDSTGVNGTNVTTGSAATTALSLSNGAAIRGGGRCMARRGRVSLLFALVSVIVALASAANIGWLGRRVDLVSSSSTVTTSTVVCGSVSSGGNSLIDTNTAILIDTSCTYSCDISNLPTGVTACPPISPVCGASDMTSTGSMTVNSGGYVVFQNVNASSKPFYLNGEMVAQSGALTEVWVDSGNITSGSGIIQLMYFLPTSGSCNNISATVETCGTGMACNTEVKSDGSRCVFILNYAEAASPSPSPSATPSSTTRAVSATSSIYTLILNQDCTNFSADTFVSIVVAIMGIAAGSITVVEKICGSVTIRYQCSGTSATEAEALCARIQAEALRAGSALNSQLGVLGSTSATTTDDDDSNDALWGLFALLVIPCAIVIGLVLFCYYRKQRQSDENYLANDPAMATYNVPSYQNPGSPIPPTPYQTPAPMR